MTAIANESLQSQGATLKHLMTAPMHYGPHTYNKTELLYELQ